LTPVPGAGGAPGVWHVLGIALSILVFSAPTFWAQSHPGAPPFELVTVALAAVVTLVVIVWPRARHASARLAWGRGAIAAACAAAALLGLALHRWMSVMLWQPLDPLRGDMLVVTQAAIRAFLNGRDPYGMYRIPWEAPLPYGPVLWLPFVVPHVLGADLRLVTIIGAAFVPAWCAVAAVVEAARSRLSQAAVWLVLLAVIVLNPELATFVTVGHTPSYWPLLPLFAVFVTAGRWNASAVVLGMLVAGRTTMISIVPLFFAAVWWRSREHWRSTLLLAGASLALLIMPFAVWNPSAIWDGMVASYPRVMKGFVWTSPEGLVVKTIGLTGPLVAHQLQRYVETAQVVAMCVIYALAWRFIRRGAPPLPWMAAALFGFSMTTLWPVYYVYFDVFMLLASGAVALALDSSGDIVRTLAAWAGSLAATTAAVGFTLVFQARSHPEVVLVDGTHRALYRGFVTAGDALGDSASIWGTDATLALPRVSASAADIVADIRPVIPKNSGPQVVTALLNGVPIGTVTAERGWTTVRFHPPDSAWRIGSNRLDLQCASSSVPIDVGLGGEARHISLSIRRVGVVAPG
jgi:hypothetical protein